MRKSAKKKKIQRIKFTHKIINLHLHSINFAALSLFVFSVESVFIRTSTSTFSLYSHIRIRQPFSCRLAIFGSNNISINLFDVPKMKSSLLLSSPKKRNNQKRGRNVSENSNLTTSERNAFFFLGCWHGEPSDR